MTVHIALLRGINVAGHRPIKMADLRTLCAGIKLKNVQSYIQSGNLVFDSAESDPARLERAITDAIAAEYGFDVTVRVLSRGDLAQIIAENPLARGDSRNPAHLHATLLAGKAPNDALERIDGLKTGEEEIHIGERAVYLYCPNGYGRSKLSNPAIERKLDLAATTRNWRTLNKLLEMAEKG